MCHNCQHIIKSLFLSTWYNHTYFYFLFFIFLLNVCNYMRMLSNFLLFHAAVHERLLWSNDDFVLLIDSTFHDRFIIDVEFLDLTLCSLNVTC